MAFVRASAHPLLGVLWGPASLGHYRGPVQDNRALSEAVCRIAYNEHGLKGSVQVHHEFTITVGKKKKKKSNVPIICSLRQVSNKTLGEAGTIAQ